MGHSGFLLAVGTSGSAAVLDRYARELEGFAAIEGEEEAAFWRRVRNFAPDYLSANPHGAVARVSTPVSDMTAVLDACSGPVVARAGTGVSYVCFDRSRMASDWAKVAAARGWKAVVEWAAPEAKESLELWPAPGGDLEVMKSVKRMFDPDDLLNKGRLYGRI
jgi:FAD/FMN-containing dehydrogenase